MDNQDIDNTKQIEKYLNGEMTDEEMLSFEKKMAEDNEFENEVIFHKNLVESLKFKAGEIKLREQLTKIGDAYRQEENDNEILHKPQRIILRWSFLAAAVIGIFFISYVIYTIFKKSDSTDIFNQYYTNYPAMQFRGQDSILNDVTKSAFYLYNSGNFKDAAVAFDKLSKESNTNNIMIFYAGVSNLANGDFISAEKYLLPLSLSEDFILNKTASWYLGLTYLKGGEQEKALAVFRKLAASGGNYAKKSKEILSALE